MVGTARVAVAASTRETADSNTVVVCQALLYRDGTANAQTLRQEHFDAGSDVERSCLGGPPERDEESDFLHRASRITPATEQSKERC